MFNGIIYNQGIIKGLKKNPRYISGSLVLEIISNIKLTMIIPILISNDWSALKRKK